MRRGGRKKQAVEQLPQVLALFGGPPHQARLDLNFSSRIPVAIQASSARLPGLAKEVAIVGIRLRTHAPIPRANGIRRLDQFVLSASLTHMSTVPRPSLSESKPQRVVLQCPPLPGRATRALSQSPCPTGPEPNYRQFLKVRVRPSPGLSPEPTLSDSPSSQAPAFRSALSPARPQHPDRE